MARVMSSRRVRIAMVAVVWLAGLAAGFSALLSLGARFGCADGDTSLACGDGGTAIGGVLTAAVVVVVTAVTVGSVRRTLRVTTLLCAAGVVALALCTVIAWLLLNAA